MAFNCNYIGNYRRGCDYPIYSTTGCQTTSPIGYSTLCICSGNNCNGGSTVAPLAGLAFAIIVGFVQVVKM